MRTREDANARATRMERVLVVGAGAIGTWLSVSLVEGGAEVTLLARTARASRIRAEGLTLVRLPGVMTKDQASEATLRPGARFHVTDTPRRLPGEVDLVVFAVRAYQTAEAADALATAGVDARAFLTIQNGLGNAEVLADRFGAHRVLAGTTSHGVRWDGPASATHTGLGDTHVGPWRRDGVGLAQDVQALLARSGIETNLLSTPRPALWTKVAINAAINPLTALHRCLNGDLLDQGPLEQALVALAREVALVASAEGVDLQPEAAAEAAVQVARRTAANRSSMLQAREAGKPMEVEAITGQVVRRAGQHGIDVPANRRILAALRAVQEEPAE